MSIFNIEQQAVVSAADEALTKGKALRKAIADLIGEKLKANKLALIPNDEQNKTVSELLKLIRTASDGTVWVVNDCRDAKEGTAMHKAGQRYEQISKAYSRMKPKAKKTTTATTATTADPKKPGNVLVLPVKAAEIAGFCDGMTTMLQNVGDAEYDIARVKAALIALKEAAKPISKKK